MRLFAAAIVCALLAAATLQAGQGPFDMSPERANDAPAMPAAPVSPALVVQPDASSLRAPAPAAAATVLPARRYLLPSADFVLTGEDVEAAWMIYLTPEQAASAATLNIGYQNAVVVAPETSRFRVLVNGSNVIEAAIGSSEAVADVATVLPKSLLHAGFNDLRIETVQRHRTDCSIESTYELWTEFDPARTYLAFSAADAGVWKRFDDVRAIGVDPVAATTFNIVVPAFDQPASTAPVIRLSEGLALLAGMPNQSVTISRTGVPPQAPGSVTVVLGTGSELSGVLAALPDGALTAPTAAVVDDPRFGPSTLVVTGPSWQAIGTAIEAIVGPVDRPVTVQRKSLSTRSWRSPDSPMLLSAARLKFSEIGVATREFSGRRFHADFAVAVPSDFFANSYGEATILLDAAYSEEVLPGSHIDVYVNDDIAATVPITDSGGQILRHLPIKVTMRHFRPGSNRLAIEAILMTAADTICAPGAAAQGGQRFALFDTSEFVMPDFARIGQRPNLAAFGGTGFPYSRAPLPLAVIFDHTQPAILAAAATFLARISVSSSRLVQVDTNVQATALDSQNAVFLGPIATLPAGVLGQIGISEASLTSWGQTIAVADTAVQPDTETALSRWRQRLQRSGWRSQVTAFKDWLRATFNLSMETFRLVPGADVEFMPAGNDSLVVAQQSSPLEGGTWTVVTAPTTTMLEDGITALTAELNWLQIGGHVSSYDAATGKVARVAVGQATFIPTQPASFSNYRLIVANWLSANALSYSLLLTLFSILLGVATSGLLGSLGRKQ